MQSTSSEPCSGRRSFLSWLAYGLAAIAAAATAIPFIGYLFGARKAGVDWVRLGPVTDFPENQTRRVDFDNPLRQPWDGMVANTSVYVRYEGADDQESDEANRHKFLVLAVNCAHLGCPVEWFQESGLFLCPCHGGVYYANGEHASGPPPRGLYHCDYRVTRAGDTLQLEIQAPHFPTLQNTLRRPA
jgi:menaquinol-cytochrome c reductase iron-sulfur subunit